IVLTPSFARLPKPSSPSGSLPERSPSLSSMTLCSPGRSPASRRGIEKDVRGGRPALDLPGVASPDPAGQADMARTSVTAKIERDLRDMQQMGDDSTSTGLHG